MAKNPYLKRAHATSEFDAEKILEIKRCSTDPIYFMERYVKVFHPTKGEVAFILYDYQKDMIRAIHENKDVVILASRQLGKTTVVGMYMLWLATFSKAKCVIASKDMDHAVEIQTRIKFAYEMLPEWLKAGCVFYNHTRIEFDNKSVIKCEPTTEKTGRGGSPTMLYLDEISFVSKRIQDKMWASIAPSLSTGGKLIITSTPNGDSDLFARLWSDSLAGLNNFVHVQALWWMHPDRGEAYYKEMAEKLGPVLVKQELDCEFLSSDALLINSMRLNALRFERPLWESLGFRFWVPEEQLGGRNKIYMVSMDPATGSGRDFTVIQIFEFPSLQQVGEYRTNDVNIPLIYGKLTWLLRKLTELKPNGRAEVLWTFERNGIGEAISALHYNDERQVDEAELVSDSPTKFGVFTSGRTKVLYALQLKNLVEKTTDKGLKLKSELLIHELKHYVSKGNGYEAKAGYTDDCVAALLGIMRLLKRLSEYNEDAFKQVNEYVDPEAPIDESNDYVPFSIL